MARPVVYLIYPARPYKHARHYIGWTENPRASRRRAPIRARKPPPPLVAAAVRAGIEIQLAAT
jgi:hypothetical protein